MDDLVTLQEARYHLRLDGDSSGGPDDGWLAIFIPAISQAVALWLKDDFRLYVPEVDSSGEDLVDSSGEPIPSAVVKPVVKAACLVELSSQYRFREGEGENTVPADAGYGYVLSKGATALLAGIRKSTVI